MTVKTNYRFSIAFLVFFTIQMIAIFSLISERVFNPINPDFPEIEKIQVNAMWTFAGIMAVGWVISMYAVHVNYNRMVKENERRYNAGH